jgi:hypothetical protein
LAMVKLERKVVLSNENIKNATSYPLTLRSPSTNWI